MGPQFFAITTSLLLFSFLSGSIFSTSFARNCPSKTTFAIGSFTESTPTSSRTGEGVTFALHNGTVITKSSLITPAITGRNPTFIAKSLNTLYVVNSLSDGNLVAITFLPRPPYISSFSINTPEQLPAHVSVVYKASGFSKKISEVLAVANFNGATAKTFRRQGRTLKLLDTFIVPSELASQARNPNVTNRQRDPHPHMALPYKRGILVPDLGADFVFYLNVNRGTGIMTELQRVEVRPGDGPRHAIEHKSGAVFVVNELSSSLATLTPEEDGRLSVTAYHDLLDAGLVENATAAAIRLTKDQRFLYVSVRPDGRDTPVDGVISGFRISREGKVVEKIGEWSTEGVHPRDFYIVEGLRVGRQCRDYIAVANRDSNEVVFIRKHYMSGLLGNVEFRLNVQSPSSVLPLT